MALWLLLLLLLLPVHVGGGHKKYKELGRKKHNEERIDVEEGKLMSKGKEHFPTELLCRTTGATG